MIGKIVFSLISFLLFVYIFIFKLIKKNDTTYLFVLISQAIGIALNFIQILFNVLNGAFFVVIAYLLCIIIPALILALEIKGLNASEYLSVGVSKILIFFGKRKKAKDILNNLVSKYDKSYLGHKTLAEIYQEEGGMRKAIDEYVKVLDIRSNDYKSYFKISKLLNDLGKKDEAIEMLKILSKQKPELYEPGKMLGDLLLEKESFKEAIYAYTQAIKADLEKAEAYFELAKINMMKNQKNKAILDLNKLLKIDTSYYKKMQKEPVFFSIKQTIQKPEIELEPNYKDTEIEKEIEEYLKDTYNLTKILNGKEDKLKNINNKK